MRTVSMLYRSAVGIAPERTIREAAELMEQAGVGSLGVVEDGRIIGIVTDRDLVRRAMARGLPLDSRIDSVMSTPVVSIGAGDEYDTAFAAFGTHGIRRLAVIDTNGKFVGMLTIDDLLITVARQLSDLARPVTAEVLFAHRDPGVPAKV